MLLRVLKGDEVGRPRTSALWVPGTQRDYPTQRNNFHVKTDEQTFIISNQYTRIVSKASELLGVTRIAEKIQFPPDISRDK